MVKNNKFMYLWRASLINRNNTVRIQVEVAAPDYDNAVILANNVNPEYDKVEWCRKILSFTD